MADKNKPQDGDGLDAYDLAEEKPQAKKPVAINPTLFLGDAPAEKPQKNAPIGKPAGDGKPKRVEPDTPAAHPKLVDPLELARKREEGRKKMADEQAAANARKFKVKMVVCGVLVATGAGVWLWLRMRS